ncbi:MAG TPA: tetratricopeptide repeat protein [Terriglobales bacterium]|nr:tetratricopeptide repeat protein [Terriglobales bacterium]
MKTLTMSIAVLALLAGFRTYSLAEPDPDQGKTMATMSVGELEIAADEARAQKDYSLAIDYFRAALRKEPKNAVLYNKLGMAELKKGDTSPARTHFQKSAKLDPKYSDPLNNIGAIEFGQKKLGSAAKYFKKAVALDETRATFHVNLGAAWFGQGKVDRAIVEYTRALQLDPLVLSSSSRTGVIAQITSPEERARYSYMLAKIYARLGDVESCLRCLRKAKEDGYRELANVYKDAEFAGLRQDTRLSEVVPPPAK